MRAPLGILEGQNLADHFHISRARFSRVGSFDDNIHSGHFIDTRTIGLGDMELI